MWISDGNGYVSVEELGTTLRALGKNPSEAELQEIIKRVDTDGDGKIGHLSVTQILW